MWLQILLAFCGSLAFAVLLGVPRSHLLEGAICGALAWSIYLLVMARHMPEAIGITLAAFCAALAAELLARVRKTPATLFLVPGVIPLVPGLLTYQSMFSLVSGKPLTALGLAAQALLLGAGITAGVAAVQVLIRVLPGGHGGSQRW